jgi:hypothetical protein
LWLWLWWWGWWSLVWLLQSLAVGLVWVGFLSLACLWWGYWIGNVLVFVATLRKNKPYFVATFGEINLIL